MKMTLKLRKDFIKKSVKSALEDGREESIFYALHSVKVYNKQYYGGELLSLYDTLKRYGHWSSKAFFKLGYLQALADTGKEAILDNDEEFLGKCSTEGIFLLANSAKRVGV